MPTGRKTGGRQKGTPNKVTADIRAAAQRHGGEGLAAILGIAREAERDETRLSAWNIILDRAYGKPKQPLTGGDEDDRPIELIERHIVRPGDTDR